MKMSCKLLTAIAVAVGLGLSSSAMASPCERTSGWDTASRGVHYCDGHSHFYKCVTFKKTFCSGKTVYVATVKKIKSHGEPVNDRVTRVLKFDHPMGKAGCAEVYNRPF